MDSTFRFGGRAISLTVFAVVVVAVAALLISNVGQRAEGAEPTGPFPSDFVGIGDVPPSPAPAPGQNASKGTLTERCGRNEENHRNEDNLVVSPGLAHGAHHTHDYVGNLSTTALSTDTSLAASATTCTNGDKSTYYWPVLRRQDMKGTGALARGSGAGHGNVGMILPPASVTVQYRGNPASAVVPMPRFLRMITGDPVAGTVGLANAHAQWGCSGFPHRHTMRYPKCPAGQQLTRTMDFPDCWNGLDTDTPIGHRKHVAFAASDGVCPSGMFPIPQVHVVVSYDVPSGAHIAVDSFSEQKHDPVTDHAGFVDVMTDAQMAKVVKCLNDGRQC